MSVCSMLLLVSSKGSRFSGQLAFSHGLDLKLINVCNFLSFFLFNLCELLKIQ